MAAEPDFAQEEKDSKAGKRVKEFINDPHVKQSIIDRQNDIAKKLWRAKPDEVMELWYEGKALETAISALRVTIDKAEKVELDRDTRDRLAARQTPRSR